MRLFSVLLVLVCIGCVLMLAENAAAQQAKIEFTAEADDVVVVERQYEIGDETTLTITLRRGGALVLDQPVTFRVIGIVDQNNRPLKEDPTVASVSPPSGSTGDNGRITTMVTFRKSGRIGIEAEALDSRYVHAFQVKPKPKDPVPPEPTTRIVAPPKVEGPLAVGDTFTYSIEIKYVKDLAGWQMDLAYNPAVLEFVGVREGDFLASGGVNAAFQSGTLSAGKITGIWQARVGRTVDATGENVLIDPVEGVDGSGELLSIEFRVRQFAEEALGLHNVHLSDSANFTTFSIPAAVEPVPDRLFFLDAGRPRKHERIAYYIISNPVVVTHQYPREDVNRDGMVDVLDLVTVAGQLGEAATNPRADVNNDGFVNVMDVILVARHPNWGESVKPIKVRDANDQVGKAPLSASIGQSADLTPAKIQGWIDLAQVEDDGSAIFDLGIANLERLLQATVPEETKLLLNYPNPFNPETWIPYQLAKATDVTVSIYSVNGALVRTLALGHQAAGVYQSKSQAAYWDGRNELGERIASGVYFYTLTAGDFSATGKMLVRK